MIASFLVAARAQDPSSDLPSRRLGRELPRDECVERGLTRLEAGWDWEAARAFRELAQRDDARSLGSLGLALALRREPNRAARLLWQAVKDSADASAPERRLLGIYQRYFGVNARPEIVDPRFARAPGRTRLERLVADLEEIVASGEGVEFAARLLTWERRRLRGVASSIVDEDVERVLRSHHAYLQSSRAMPYRIPGYRTLLARHLTDAPDRAVRLARLPRHPAFVDRVEAAASVLPGSEARGPSEWRPVDATGFDLPRGLGGRGTFDPRAGQPTLVVFFLGFG